MGSRETAGGKVGGGRVGDGVGCWVSSGLGRGVGIVSVKRVGVGSGVVACSAGKVGVELGNWGDCEVTEPGGDVGLTWLQAVISTSNPIKIKR